MNAAAAHARTPRRTTGLSCQQTLSAFARYWLAERGTVAIILALLLAIIAAEAATPIALGELAGAIASIGAMDRAGALSPWPPLAAAGAAMAAAILLRQVLDRRWNALTVRSLQRLQLDLFARVQRLPAEWHANSFAGATVHRISRARWALDMLSNIIVLRLLQPALLVLVMGSILTWRLPLAGLAFFGLCFVYIMASWWLSAEWVRPVSVVAASRDSRLTGALADSITNNATVKSFGTEQREDELLRTFSDHWVDAALRSFNRATDTNAVQQMLWTVAQVAVLGLIAWQSLRSAADIADAAYAMSAVALLSGQLRNLAQDIRTIQRAYAELEDAAEFLLATPEDEGQKLVSGPDRRSHGDVAGSIVFESVSFSYPSGSRVYDDLSFCVEPGEQVALVGPSGSGKSTVVKLIQRLYDLEGGKVLLDGRDIRELSPIELRGMISVVPQEPILFHRSLADNIAYGRPEATLEEIREAARRARADEFIARLKDGYASVVGERGAKLSGGERQRVAIARAILADRPILLLDEATSSLDTSTERLVQEAIGELAKGRTTIIIAHRLSTVRRANRILVFDKGRIVEQGSHDQLVTRQSGHYRRLLELSGDGSAEQAPVTAAPAVARQSDLETQFH